MRSSEVQPDALRRWRDPHRWGGLAAGVAPLRAVLGWQILALLIVSGVLLLGAYQVERPIAVDVGGPHETPFVENFHRKEEPDPDDASYRWTHATSFLRFAGIGGERDRRLTVRLRSGRPAGATWPVAVVVNGVELARTRVGPEWQTVQVEVAGAATQAHGALVELRTTANRLPTSEGREVGVQVDRVRLETTGGGRTVPAWDTVALTLLAILVLYLVALRGLALARPPGPRDRSYAALGAAAGALALAGLFALARPYVTATVPTLLGLLLGILATLFLPGPLRRLGARCGLAVTGAEARALAAILALGIAAKLGGLLYPDTVVIDLAWHVRWERILLGGDFAALYFPSSLSSGPREWGEGVLIPKSPLYYVAMAPVTLLPLDIGTALKLAAGLLDVAMALFAFAVLRRLGRGGAGVVAALLYTVTPLSYLWLSFGTYPTLFAQFLTLLAFAVVLFAGERLDRPAIFALFVALVTLSLLAYPVVAVFNCCVLVAFGLWRRLGATGAGAARRALLLPAGTALAALLALVAYYGQYVRVTLASLTTMSGAQSRTQQALAGGPLDRLGHVATIVAKNVQTGNLALLLILAVAGAILLRREGAGGEERRVWQFLLLWLLVLPVFTVADAYVELLFKPLFYTMIPVALFAGVAVAALWRRGRAGRVTAVLCCAIVAAQAWVLWIERIAYTGQIVR